MNPLDSIIFSIIVRTIILRINVRTIILSIIVITIILNTKPAIRAETRESIFLGMPKRKS